MKPLSQRIAPLILRLGIAGFFLWFGVSQILAPQEWISWVPTWVPVFFHGSERMVVLLNGGFETVCGALLLLGIGVRWVALLLFLHTLSIAYELGYGDIAIRDACIAVAALSLALFEVDEWALHHPQRRL